MENLAFLSQITLLVLIAPIFATYLKISVSIIEIILGALVVWIGFIENQSEFFNAIAKIGFFYLMFLAGLEINIKKFISFKDKFLKKAILYFLCLYGISFSLYFLFNLHPVYIVAIPIVSLGMIMTLINEHGKKHKWLELALIIGIIGELISISALVIFDATIIYGFGKELYKNIAILIGVLLITYFSFKGLNILFWWFPKLKKIIMPDNDNMNQDIRFSMTLFFILIAIMQHLHLDMVLGSFIAGVFIANFFTHKIELPHTLHIVGFGFLIPLFFIYVGTTLDLNLLFTKEIIQKALYIILAMVFARIISSFVAYYQYLGLRDTILFSLGDSMPLTFLIAISTIAVNNHAITINEYYAFILAAILEAIVIVILIKFIMSKNSIQ